MIHESHQYTCSLIGNSLRAKAPLLTIKNLSVTFQTPTGSLQAVRNLSLTAHKGERIGIVGESGSGKSQIFMALMGLLPKTATVSGEMYLNNDLISDHKNLNKLRGDRMAMIFQDPMTALNPYLTIGTQLGEVLKYHRSFSRKEIKRRLIKSLEQVHIPDPVSRLSYYPHELSGGLRQRVMIAMALLCEPDILIADEPTTALDVTIQAQIFDLLRSLNPNMALIFISHDLGAVSALCDHTYVVYGGRVVETAPTNHLFTSPAHPYTQALLRATPCLNKETLSPIQGQPPNPQDIGPGCAFAPRCSHAMDMCHTQCPFLNIHKTAHHQRACFWVPPLDARPKSPQPKPLLPTSAYLTEQSTPERIHDKSK
jgi:oligopeptide transport system ATP-binding protein